MFRSRETGEVVIGQWPNLPLWVFLATAVIGRILDLDGTPERVVRVVGAAALAWWAVDEMLRGVNPFRRLLGAFVLLVTIAGLVL